METIHNVNVPTVLQEQVDNLFSNFSDFDLLWNIEHGCKLSRDLIMGDATGDLLSGNLSPWDTIGRPEFDRFWNRNHNSDHRSKTLLCLSKLRKLSPNGTGKRINRRSGAGTWHGENAKEDIIDYPGNRLLGFKKTFTFWLEDPALALQMDDRELLNQGHWIMHQYSLFDRPDYVLCKIKRDFSKPLKISPKTLLKIMHSSSRPTQLQPLSLPLRPPPIQSLPPSPHANFWSSIDDQQNENLHFDPAELLLELDMHPIIIN